MMRVRLKVVVNFALGAALLLTAALSSDASAQTPAQRESRPQDRSRPAPPPRQSATQAPRESEADASADLSINARVTAESLRFERVPNPRVEFTGQPRRETAWESERENLPDEVRPGETYRNIGITLHIRSVFADIDRIVAEALGEVPPSDDAQPAPPQPQPPGAGTPPTAPTTPPTRVPAADTTTRQRRGTARRGRGN